MCNLLSKAFINDRILDAVDDLSFSMIRFAGVNFAVEFAQYNALCRDAFI